MPLTFNFGEENRPELFEGKPKTPVTLLSGFLGTGKTTLLKHLLENQEGVRIGVVVNDVAAVNIDSQLVRRFETGLVEVAELQNGCVCCSSADDLFSAVQNIVMRSKHYDFEHIVVELSGVGEPEAVRRNWAIGLECTMPVALRTEVKQVVTVVDASTFGTDWLDTRHAQDRNEPVTGASHDEKNKARLENVGQLLAEQVEWADVVVINKTDLASQDELGTTEEVVRALNAQGRLCHASFGAVSPSLVLPPVPKGLRKNLAGAGDGYTWRQTPTEVTVRMCIEPSVKGADIDFKIGKQSFRLGVKARPNLRIPRVEGQLSGELKNLDEVMFEIDGSGQDRAVAVTLEKRRAGMWSDLWASTRADVAASEADVDVQCGECHDGHLSFGYGRSVAAGPHRAEARFGIHSFAYQRRRPFSGKRLQRLLKSWPIPCKELFRLEDLRPDPGSEALESALRPVLRSKGFCWLDSEPLRQHVWSHAGKTLAVEAADWWWGALDKEQLRFKLTYPGVESEYKAVKAEKWNCEVGDRRQELVFIGGPEMHEPSIVALLDACVLTDAELTAFAECTKGLRVPDDDDLSVTGLLKNLGATPGEIENLSGKVAGDKVAGDKSAVEDAAQCVATSAAIAATADEADTSFLRSLGVGAALDTPHVVFEAVD